PEDFVLLRILRQGLPLNVPLADGRPVSHPEELEAREISTASVGVPARAEEERVVRQDERLRRGFRQAADEAEGRRPPRPVLARERVVENQYPIAELRVALHLRDEERERQGAAVARAQCVPERRDALRSPVIAEAHRDL